MNFKSLIYLLLSLNINTYAQKQDTIKKLKPIIASASFNINNRGLSLFPNLTLGKPATVVNVSIGKKNIYFEPELRWALTAKPWSYIFWLRYKYKQGDKFGINFGVHPAYIIRESLVTINGKDETRYIAQRYFASELAPTYYFSNKFALGLHYLSSWGLDDYAVQRSNFYSLQPKFFNIKIYKDYNFNFFPQFFHLQQDSNKGTYVSEYIAIQKDKIPFSITSVFTYKIKSTIPGDDVVWNIGLNWKM